MKGADRAARVWGQSHCISSHGQAWAIVQMVEAHVQAYLT